MIVHWASSPAALALLSTLGVAAQATAGISAASSKAKHTLHRRRKAKLNGNSRLRIGSFSPERDRAARGWGKRNLINHTLLYVKLYGSATALLGYDSIRL